MTINDIKALIGSGESQTLELKNYSCNHQGTSWIISIQSENSINRSQAWPKYDLSTTTNWIYGLWLYGYERNSTTSSATENSHNLIMFPLLFLHFLVYIWGIIHLGRSVRHLYGNYMLFLLLNTWNTGWNYINLIQIYHLWKKLSSI